MHTVISESSKHGQEKEELLSIPVSVAKVIN